MGGVAYQHEEPLTSIMKQRMSWNYAKPLEGRYGWVADLGPWSGYINRVIRGLKPRARVGGSGDVQILPARIRSRM